MKKTVTTLVLLMGIALIVTACGIVMASEINQNRAIESAKNNIAALRELMPEPTNAVPDDRINVTMPTLTVEGEDFVGILELPRYGKQLAVYARWDKSKLHRQPCRFSGSCYDNSLIIGASANRGQFDFIKEISNTDRVSFIDVTGVCYNYSVTDITVAEDASVQRLTEATADLVLFARDKFSGEYIIISCKLK